MNMRERFERFLADHGKKHWSFAARKDPDFMAWVAKQTAQFPDLSFPEQVYTAVSDETPFCDHGGKKRLKSVIDGWAFCGRAGVCRCAAASVSEKCRAVHASKTADDYAEMEGSQQREGKGIPSQQTR
jgi:hypothetical protein